MPTIPLRPDFPGDQKDPVRRDDLIKFFRQLEVWTEAVAVLLNSGVLTRLIATGVTVPITSASVVVTLAVAQPDTNYQVVVDTDWATTTWITAKTKSAFTINFGTAAPGSQKLSYTVLR